jgi:hypothetical protein
MSLVDKIMGTVKYSVSTETKEPTVLLEGCDQINRVVRLCQLGKKYWVEVDVTAFSCLSLKDAELEFEFRLNDSNRNI